MTVSEQDRPDLYETFIEIFGRKEAATMIALLPPVEVATKRDVDRLAADMGLLESRVTAALEALERRLTIKIAESQKQTLLIMMGTMLATVIAVSGLAFAAAGLT
jgi:hypothetical protein